MARYLGERLLLSGHRFEEASGRKRECSGSTNALVAAVVYPEGRKPDPESILFAVRIRSTGDREDCKDELGWQVRLRAPEGGTLQADYPAGRVGGRG